MPIYCNANTVYTTNRINSAYSFCGGPKGTLLTIKHLTGLPVNYLITVNFHGFKEVVNKLGGVWMDVDRRYYNKNVGTIASDYANIDLQPGYQRLNGEQALDFVRFRHTDSDLYRVARQQEFVRSFREQVAQSFSAGKVPALVNAMASNIEVGEGGHKVQLSDLEKYAFFAYGLPSGHVFQDQIQNVVCGNQCFATPQDVAAAVQQFTNPDVTSSKAANAAALGKKLKLDDACAVVGQRDRAERQRRRRRRRQRLVPAGDARLQGDPAAERPRAERPGAVVPHEGLLRLSRSRRRRPLPLRSRS